MLPKILVLNSTINGIRGTIPVFHHKIFRIEVYHVIHSKPNQLVNLNFTLRS